LDSATTSGERLSFARCFIEISAKSTLPGTIKLNLGPDEWVDVQVQYEWVPPTCSKCCNFGHVQSQCPTVFVEKWVPKNASNVNNEKVSHVSDTSNNTNASSDTHINVDVTISTEVTADIVNEVTVNIAYADIGNEVAINNAKANVSVSNEVANANVSNATADLHNEVTVNRANADVNDNADRCTEVTVNMATADISYVKDTNLLLRQEEQANDSGGTGRIHTDSANMTGTVADTGRMHADTGRIHIETDSISALKDGVDIEDWISENDEEDYNGITSHSLHKLSEGQALKSVGPPCTTSIGNTLLPSSSDPIIGNEDASGEMQHLSCLSDRSNEAVSTLIATDVTRNKNSPDIALNQEQALLHSRTGDGLAAKDSSLSSRHMQAPIQPATNNAQQVATPNDNEASAGNHQHMEAFDEETEIDFLLTEANPEWRREKELHKSNNKQNKLPSTVSSTCPRRITKASKGCTSLPK